MSIQAGYDQRRMRRNTVAEVPFAGRIGAFQQDVEDDEKGREILKIQPDAVCPNSRQSIYTYLWRLTS